MERLYNITSVFLIILGITAIRIYYLYVEPYGLFFDEAQYWTWSKNFDWGYYSKPPIIAWLIAATTNLCGDGAVCVRFAAPILHLLTSLIVYLIARQSYDKKTAFWSSITYATLPAVTLSSYFISTDAPLLFFWALSLYCFICAIDGPYGNKWWLLLGISVGLGMLSKYTMMAFGLSAFLYLFTTKLYRPHLYSPYLWLAVIIAFMVFLPNIIWNYSHNFVSLSHTNENVFLSRSSSKIFEFIGGQLGLFGPILFLTLIWLFIIKDGLLKSEAKVLSFFFLPLFIIALVISATSGTQAHWAAPIYISGTILVVHFALRYGLVLLLKSSLILHIFLAVFFFHYHTISYYLNIKQDPFARVQVWDVLAQETLRTVAKYPGSYLLSDERKIVATLMYNLHSDGRPYPTLKWNADRITQDYYDMTTDMNKLKGKNFLLITRTPDVKHITSYFANFSALKEIDISSEKFFIYYLESFKGY